MSLTWSRPVRKAAAFVGLALTGMVAAAGGAQAVYVADGTLDNMFVNNGGTHSAGSNWQDVVGDVNKFGLAGIDVSSSTDNGGTVNLSIFTNYGLKTSGAYSTRTADISFKLTGDTGFDHGLILIDHQGGALNSGALGTSGARGDTNTLSAGFYSVTDWSTSQDIFGAVSGIGYGGVAKVCANSAECGSPATGTIVNTYLNAGERLDNVLANNISLAINQVASTVSDPITDPNGVATLFRIDVVLTGVQDLFGPSWELMFGNAICANDTIFVTGVGIPQTVPEPGSLGLVAAGMFMVGAARRARRKKSA